VATKKTGRRDRRAVAEQLRREQERRERRRGLFFLAGCVAVVLGILGAALVPYLRQQQRLHALDDTAVTAIGVPLSGAGCSPVRTHVASGNNVHVPDTTPMQYAEAPPAYGQHYATTAAFDRKFYAPGDRPALGHLVHNLEHGYNIVWYDDHVAGDPDQVEQLRAIARKYQRQKFIVAPWLDSDGAAFPPRKHVAITHWWADPQDLRDQKGIWRYCTATSGEAVADFTHRYPYTDSPEPNAM
jgi:hypothetical protein